MAKKKEPVQPTAGPKRIVFSDQAVSGVYNWTEVKDQLIATPDEWHLVFENDRVSLTVSIKAGHVAALTPVENFQVATRNNYKNERGRRMCDMWMRYLTHRTLARQLPRSRKKA